MKIQTLVLGQFETNCYVLTSDESAKDCVIIDTGLDADPLIDLLKSGQLNPEALILTHAHVDHIAGINALRQNWPEIRIAVHRDDAEMLIDPVANLSTLIGVFVKTEPADIIIDDGQTLDFAGISFDVMHTPGHTPGGISLYNKEDGIVFAGDVLFADSIGRTDFPGGSFDTLVASIKNKLLTLAAETIVYSGHGPTTTIEHESKFNQFLA